MNSHKDIGSTGFCTRIGYNLTDGCPWEPYTETILCWLSYIFYVGLLHHYLTEWCTTSFTDGNYIHNEWETFVKFSIFAIEILYIPLSLLSAIVHILKQIVAFFFYNLFLVVIPTCRLHFMTITLILHLNSDLEGVKIISPSGIFLKVIFIQNGSTKIFCGVFVRTCSSELNLGGSTLSHNLCNIFLLIWVLYHFSFIRPDMNIYPTGFEILQDGSNVFEASVKLYINRIKQRFYDTPDTKLWDEEYFLSWITHYKEELDVAIRTFSFQTLLKIIVNRNHNIFTKYQKLIKDITNMVPLR